MSRLAVHIICPSYVLTVARRNRALLVDSWWSCSMLCMYVCQCVCSLWCKDGVAKAEAVAALQVLTPAMLHTIFRRMCDPDNPNNLAGD